MTKPKYKLLFIGILISLYSCTTSKNKIDIRDYGAVGDSLQVNTIYIQKAIDESHKNGGGIVSVSEGIYITGTVLLKEGVTLEITENAKLIGSSNPLDYKSIDTFIDATGQERGNCLIGAIDVSNIGIIGKGIIDGNGKSFLYENLKAKRKELKIPKDDKKFGSNRPFLLRFVRSSNIKIKDVHLRQPAAWTCHFYQSNDITVNNVHIYSRANHNNDGIDLDSSYNAKIENCIIDTGDDAICFKTTSVLPTYAVKVENCQLRSDWGAIKFGTESMGDFYDIDIKNCKITDTRGGGVKVLSVDGANINNIKIDSLEMKQVDMPIFIRLGERLRTYRNAEKQSVGSIKNLSITNVTAVTRNLQNSRVSPPSGVFITGVPNHKIDHVTLENIHITLPGGGKEEIKEVDEQVDQYPEFSFFGPLPAYGLYGRHINVLDTTNLRFTLEENDIRKEVILQDVGDFFE